MCMFVIFGWVKSSRIRDSVLRNEVSLFVYEVFENEMKKTQVMDGVGFIFVVEKTATVYSRYY